VTSPVWTLRRSTVLVFGEMAVASQFRPHVDGEVRAEQLFARHQQARLLFITPPTW